MWSVLLSMVTVQCAIERYCRPIYQPQCATFFNGTELAYEAPIIWYTAAPLTDTLSQFNDFTQLLSLNNYCSYLLHVFLCIHYFPPCNPALNCKEIVVPCRALCEEVMAECLDYVYDHYNIARPEHLNCVNFPVNSSDDQYIMVACPNPGMHTQVLWLRIRCRYVVIYLRIGLELISKVL